MCAFGFGRATADFSTPWGRVHRGRALLAHHADAALQLSFLTPPQNLNLYICHLCISHDLSASSCPGCFPAVTIVAMIHYFAHAKADV